MESIFQIIKESLPVTSQFLLFGIVVGFIVFWGMKLYARLEKTEHATVALGVRIEKVEKKIEKVEEKIDKLDEKFDAKIDKLEEKFDRKFDYLEKKIESKFDTIISLLLKKKEEV